MSGQNMSTMLGEIFGETKTASAAIAQPTQEDLEKQAQLNFFGELCASRGIDVGRLNDEQVEELYKSAMELKTAKDKEEDPKAAKAKEEEAKKKEAESAKLASANQEYSEKRAAAQKIAEADLMGRIMARSYVDELQKLAGEMPPQFQKKDGEKPAEGKGDEKKEEDEKKKKEASDRAAAVIAEAEKAKTAGAVSTPSSTPNMDEVAARRGIELCKAAGIDETVAFNRINAVLTLGLADSTKVASAANGDAAITVRALEFCEAAGFPVDWSKT